MQVLWVILKWFRKNAKIYWCSVRQKATVQQHSQQSIQVCTVCKWMCMCVSLNLWKFWLKDKLFLMTVPSVCVCVWMSSWWAGWHFVEKTPAVSVWMGDCWLVLLSTLSGQKTSKVLLFMQSKAGVLLQNTVFVTEHGWISWNSEEWEKFWWQVKIGGFVPEI